MAASRTFDQDVRELLRLEKKLAEAEQIVAAAREELTAGIVGFMQAHGNGGTYCSAFVLADGTRIQPIYRKGVAFLRRFGQPNGLRVVDASEP